MALSTLTLAEWRERFRGVIRSLIPTASTVRGSDYEITSRMLAALAHGAQGSAVYAVRQMFPTTADGENVDRHGHERRLPRAAAAKSTGRVWAESTLAGSPIVSGATLRAADGTEFVTTGAVVSATPAFAGKTVGAGSTTRRLIVLPNASAMSQYDGILVNGEKRMIAAVLTGIGAIDLADPLLAVPAAGVAITPVTGAAPTVEAKNAGAIGNRDPGDSLSWSPAVANFAATARIVSLSGAGDLETNAEYRARIQDFDAGRPAAGNDEYWRAHARETAGVRLADAFVFPGFRGLGTVDVLPFGVSGARIVGADVVEAVQAHLDSVKAYADDVLVKAPAEGPEVALAFRVHVHPDYRPDWSEDLGVSTHGATPCTTTRVYLTIDPNAATTRIEKGDRILVAVQVGSRWRTEERTVSAAVTAAPSYVEVSTPFSAAPGLSAAVRQGGPVSQSVLDAIASVFDNLGPAVYQSIVAAQYELYWQRTPAPGVLYDGTLRASSFVAAIKGIEGVGEVDVLDFNGDTVAPFADVNPNPQAIAYAGRVLLSFNTIGAL